MTAPLRVCGLGLLTLLLGCQYEATPDPAPTSDSTKGNLAAIPAKSPETLSSTVRFTDRTAGSGVDFVYDNDEAHSDFAILESLGGGIALFDYDRDDRVDIFVPGGGTFEALVPRGRPSALFRNRGDWNFVNVTSAAGCGMSRNYSHGAAAADFDNDGFCDLAITGYGGVTLYHNQGDGTFVDVTEATQIRDSSWSSSATWGDFNSDGQLDLFVVHYVNWSPENHPLCEGPTGHPRDVCPPRQYQGLPDSLYLANGDSTWRDASTESGLQPDGKGLGVVAFDFDRDRDLDVYVANDTVGNFLYQNDGKGGLQDISLTSGTAFSDRGTPDGSMGTDASDFNGDGQIDLWVANYERENNALYRNVGQGLFRHVSQPLGIAAVGANYVGWGTRFIDLDLDGDEDLFISNGHVIRFPLTSPRRQRPMVLENHSGARFVNVTDGAGEYLASDHEGRGLATADLDGDGDEDLVLAALNDPVTLLSNDTQSQGNWLAVRVIGQSTTRTPIGTTVAVHVGDRTITRQIRGGSSFASTSDTTLIFGLGAAPVVQDVTVEWLGGGETVRRDIAANQVVSIIQSSDDAASR